MGRGGNEAELPRALGQTPSPRSSALVARSSLLLRIRVGRAANHWAPCASRRASLADRRATRVHAETAVAMAMAMAMAESAASAVKTCAATGGGGSSACRVVPCSALSRAGGSGATCGRPWSWFL